MFEEPINSYTEPEVIKENNGRSLVLVFILPSMCRTKTEWLCCVPVLSWGLLPNGLASPSLLTDVLLCFSLLLWRLRVEYSSLQLRTTPEYSTLRNPWIRAAESCLLPNDLTLIHTGQKPVKLLRCFWTAPVEMSFHKIMVFFIVRVVKYEVRIV